MIPTKVARAAGSGASVPVECCQVCGHAPLETMLSLGYMPPVNQMVRLGEVPRQQPWFPTTLLFCSSLRAGAARPCGRSRHHLPAGISLHQRDDQAAARQFRRALCRVVEARSSSARTISSSTSARTTARCCRISVAGHRVLGIEPTDVATDRAEARHPDRPALFHADHGARGEVPARHRQARHRRQLLRAYRGRACDRRGHHRPAGARRRVHLGIALSDRPARQAAIRHGLPRASALLFAHEPRASPRHARPRRVPRAADPDPRRLDPRLCGTQRHARDRAERCGHARRRAARRGHARAAQGVLRRGDALQAAAPRAHPRREGEGRAHRRHQRAVARVDAGELCRARRSHHRLRLRDRGLAQDRHVHARHAHPDRGRGRLFTDQPDCAIIFSWHIAEELAPKLRQKGYRGKLVTPLPVPREL